MKKFNRIINNLPRLNKRFVGRREITTKILSDLRNNEQVSLIVITGIGGIGKTALALQISDSILRENSLEFEYIIWMSARSPELTKEGLIPSDDDFSIANYNNLLST